MNPQDEKEKYEHLLTVMRSRRFLDMQGLGNEIPFFICPFKANRAIAMEKLVTRLTNALENHGIHILTINLYDLSIELLKKRNIWDRILQSEASLPKDQLKELLQGVLDPEQHLVPAMAAKMDNAVFDILFITGVGEVFPYIRSHTVLNNLQRVAKNHPTVMFFPGEYTHSPEKGSSLDLFGKLQDDKYYRAFNIYHTHV